MKLRRALGSAWKKAHGLVGLLLLSALIGCNRENTGLVSGRALPPIPAAPAPGYPMSVESADGQTSVLATRPTRILPANAAAVDLVTSLAPSSSVVGLPEHAFTYARLALEPDTWRDKPIFKTYEVERLLELRPDLVLCDPWQAATTTSGLRQAGVPVVVIPPVESAEDLDLIIPLYGALLDERDSATALLEDCRRRLAALAAQASRRSHISVLVYTNQGTGGWTSGAETTADELLTLVGLENCAARAGLRGHLPIDHERLITLDPDVILLPSSLHDETHSPSEAVLRGDPALGSLRALKDGTLVVFPPRLLSAGSHVLVDAAEQLARRIDALGLGKQMGK
ncbi:MAG: ABC transporter substrate-binding protein [Planctomycetota bacterium]|nr:ABC transporter substrate-binding protein [Planctomycetota bacterium]MDP6838840.1 ABC transporter substrate-binding protein [Planctomycetota bacterium]